MRTIPIEQAMSMKFPEWVGFLVTRGEPPASPANIMPVGWMMCCSFEPPMMAVAVGRTRHTNLLLRRTGRFVLAFAGESQADLVRQTGSCSGRDTDKFARLGIPFETGEITGCPLLAEAALNFECEVAGTLDTGDHTVFAARILAAHAPDRPIRKIENFGADRFLPARPA